MLIQNKDDIEFVTECPCLLGHPVHFQNQPVNKKEEYFLTGYKKCISFFLKTIESHYL